MTRTMTVYEAHDLVQDALAHTGMTTNCPSKKGPHCPRCRLADAKGRLDKQFGWTIQYDWMLETLARRVPDVSDWTRETSDTALRALITE